MTVSAEPRTGAGLTLLWRGFVFSVGGGALLGISGGSQGLLAFFAVGERTVTRHQVAGRYGRSSGDRASANLRAALSLLDGRPGAR